MTLPIIQKRKFYFIFSGTLIVITLLSMIAWGLKPGIDFTGGSLMEVYFKNRPDNIKIQESLKDLNLGEVNIQPAGSNNVIFRFKDVTEEVHHEIINKIKTAFQSADNSTAAKPENNTPGISIVDDKGNPVQGLAVQTTDNSKTANSQAEVVELRFDSVGPSVGQELRQKAFKAIAYVIIAIVLYIAWAFRHVSKPVNSWKYGVAAVIALIHDVIILLGVFVFLGHYFDIEINTPFIVALLTIAGYSVNDTIIVFDRTRENLRLHHFRDFEETVNNSVNETLSRSINTSLATMLSLLAIYFFGGESVKNFSLVLIIGIISGTYSSIFIASPLLVTWHKLSERLARAGR